ncbi:MAG: hypothetical protein ACRDHU_04560 [Actinomycetota bacterium]
MGTLALILVPAALLVVAIALVLSFRRGASAERRGPWWRSPVVWVAASAVWLLIGIFLVPRLLGFTFILLPIVWNRALGGRRRQQRSREE